MPDEVRTARRAERFAVGSHAPGPRTDAHLDPAGQDLLARLLLAVALDGRPISDVDTWLTRPTHETAVDVLREHGFPLTADQVAGVTAARSSGGRLGTPLLGVLDEAANVCRWRELPNLYSLYGSRGIVLMTILQS